MKKTGAEKAVGAGEAEGGKVRVLLVGCGSMANRHHYPSLHTMKDVEMAAICDLVEEKRDKTADRFGIAKRYTDYREMLEKEEADACYILMPPHHLFDIVIAALRRKLDVFIEKPPGVTIFQLRSFTREAEREGVFGMTGFNRRYIPIINHAKKAVEEKGPVTQAVVTFYKQNPAVYYNGAIGALGSDAIHAVDSIRYLVGADADVEVEEVHCVSANYGDVTDNAWNAVMRFSNGATGVLLTNWNVGGRVHTFEIHAPGVSAFIDANDKGRIIRGDEVEELDTREVAGNDDMTWYYGHYNQARHFIDCVKSRELPSSCWQDSVRTVELVDMIREGGHHWREDKEGDRT